MLGWFWHVVDGAGMLKQVQHDARWRVVVAFVVLWSDWDTGHGAGMLKQVQHDARWRVVVAVLWMWWEAVRLSWIFRCVSFLNLVFRSVFRRHPGLDPGSPSISGYGRMGCRAWCRDAETSSA